MPMKRAAMMMIAALAATLAANAAPVRTATEGFVTNKIAEAVGALPAPDYSPTNAALVATIEAVAPAPGNYAAVSNAAMSAVQPAALADATNAIPRVEESWDHPGNALTADRAFSADFAGVADEAIFSLWLYDERDGEIHDGSYFATTNGVAEAIAAALDGVTTEETDPVWNAAKTNYFTKAETEREITIRLTSTNAYISVSNGVQRIYEVDGTNRILKWEWDMGFAAISNQVRTLVAQMLRKIEDPHGWSDFAASGVSNQFAGATMLDRGSVYFGDTNVQWTASNGFAVMTGHLPVAASGSASQFRIGVDADDWFGMEVAAAYLVDAHSDSFRVVPAANDTMTATITTDYDASYESAPPVVYHSVSLAEPFARLSSGVTWQHDASTHVSTVTIQGLTGSSGFFFLKKWAAGGAIMRSTMPFLPEGYRVETTRGEYVGTVQPDSIITIQSGGRNYRVIAEEAQ